jgi:hypothetical protein
MPFNALDEYLELHGFREVSIDSPKQPGISIKAYENQEFRIHLVNERKNDHYIMVAPLGMPKEGYFLSGLVAFFTGDDAPTWTSGMGAEWLTAYHSNLVSFFSRTYAKETS